MDSAFLEFPHLARGGCRAVSAAQPKAWLATIPVAMARVFVSLASGSSGGKVIEDHPSDAARHASCISPISLSRTSRMHHRLDFSLSSCGA